MAPKFDDRDGMHRGPWRECIDTAEAATHFQPPEHSRFCKKPPLTQNDAPKGTRLMTPLKLIFVGSVLLHLNFLTFLHPSRQHSAQLTNLPPKDRCQCIDCIEDELCGGLWHANRYPGTPPDKELRRNKKIRIVISHCNKSLSWLRTFIEDFSNVASIHVLSKCGVEVEKAGVPNVHVLLGTLPNVGRNDHAFAYYITTVLPSLTSPDEDSIIVFLKDSVTGNVHQGHEFRKLDLLSMIRLASSENGFGCGLGVVHRDTSAYHDTTTWSTFNLGLYQKGDWDYTHVKTGKDKGEVAPFLSQYENLGAFYQSLPIPPQSEEKLDVTPVCYGGIFSASLSNIYKHDMSVWKALQTKLERGDNIQEGHYAERSWARLLSTPLKPYQVEALKNYATGVMEKTYSTHGPLVRTPQEGDVTYMNLYNYVDEDDVVESKDDDDEESEEEEDCAYAGTSCAALSCCSNSTSCVFVSEFGDSICIHENVTLAQDV